MDAASAGIRGMDAASAGNEAAVTSFPAGRSYAEERDERSSFDEAVEPDVEKRDVGSAGPSPVGGVVSQVDEESSFTR